MRLPSACVQCRKAKRSCGGTKSQDACDRCRRKDLKCSRHPPQKRQQHPSHDSLLPQSNKFKQELDLPSDTAVEMVELYLERVNNGRPHSLFHPEYLRARLRDGSLGRPLLYAICAVGARFSSNPDVRTLGPRLLYDAKRLLQLDMENTSLEHLQTCILITTLSVDASNTSEALFHRIATTMADILQLNSKPRSDLSLVMAEERRRAWWSLYMSDKWCVSGLGVLTPLNHTEIHLELPMNETEFFSIRMNQPNTLGPFRPGLFAKLIQISLLYNPIQDLNRSVAQGVTPTPDLDNEVNSLAEKLENWKATLPPNTQMSLENLHTHQESGSGGYFVLIHLTYHYFSTLLYFRFLEKHDEHKTIPAYVDYVTLCKSHASSFSILLRRARQLKGCEPMFPLIGHMTTVSSSVLLHALLFGEAMELKAARHDLQANFEALTELQQYWPATSAMVSRLVRFQDTCLLSLDNKPHRLDGWMLRFLLERSLAGQEDLKGSPRDSARVAVQARNMENAGRYMRFPTP